MTASLFLLPNGTFIVELVVFLAVIFIVGKYVLPFINKAMAQRQEEIRSELAAAEAARVEAAQADEERRQALEQARQQAREIVAQANRTAEKVTADGQQRGQAEFERLVASATAEVELARQRALEEASAHLGEVVVEVVERIIGREVNAEAHRDLLDEAIRALASSSDTAGATAGGAGA
jgi:F-type H+-transporting ATPase subunit b